MDPRNEPPAEQDPSWSHSMPSWARPRVPGEEAEAEEPVAESPRQAGPEWASPPASAAPTGQYPQAGQYPPDGPAASWVPDYSAPSPTSGPLTGESYPGSPPGPPAPPYGGYSPYPYGPSEPQATAGPSKRRRGLAALVVAAVVVAGAGIGTGIAVATRHDSNNASSNGSGATPTTGSGPGLAGTPATSGSMTTAQVAKAVDPAIVDINTVVQLAAGSGEAAGTGMIVTSTGEIITNNHVVASSTSIKVTIAGRGTYVAHVVGTDPTADVAVIQVTGVSGLPTVKFGNSSSADVGTSVVAIGNALGLGGTPTVTSGTITALGRAINATDSQGSSEHLTGMLETDAPIQPGDSGGPLVNRSGQIVGMDTAALTVNNQSSTVGFAIPINRVLTVANEIEQGKTEGGQIIFGLPAFLGIGGQTTGLSGSGPSSGAGIIYVQSGSPASQAGIVPGDVITAFDGHATTTINRLATLIRERRPGDRATVTFESSSGTHTATVTLATGPAA